MPDRRAGSVYLVSAISWIAVSLFLMAGLNRSWSAFVGTLTSHGITQYFQYFLLAVLPPSLPALLVGSFLAGRMLRREPRGRPFAFWALRGVAFGGALGATGCIAAVVPVALASGSAVGPLVPLSVIVVAASAGAVIGTMVATYCWRVARAAPVCPDG